MLVAKIQHSGSTCEYSDLKDQIHNIPTLRAKSVLLKGYSTM